MKEKNIVHLNSCKKKRSSNFQQQNSNNELILPQIYEINKNATRIDSGINKDLFRENTSDSFKCKNRWTLSSNCTDELENSFKNTSAKKTKENTSIELIKGKEILRKNKTSSTLLSYDHSFSNNSNSKTSTNNYYQNFSSDNLNGSISNQALKIKSTKDNKKDEKIQNHLQRDEINLALNNTKEKLLRRNSNISDYYPREFLTKKSNQKTRFSQKNSILSMDQIINSNKKKEYDKNGGHLQNSVTRGSLYRSNTVHSNIQSNSANNNLNNPEETNKNKDINEEIISDEIEQIESNCDIEKEAGLSKYTFSRIVDWLKQIENCSKVYKTPSELEFSNTSNEKDQSKENDCDLSEYGSYDDQIIEYNRIVDKTFHIIHRD